MSILKFPKFTNLNMISEFQNLIYNSELKLEKGWNWYPRNYKLAESKSYIKIYR